MDLLLPLLVALVIGLLVGAGVAAALLRASHGRGAAVVAEIEARHAQAASDAAAHHERETVETEARHALVLAELRSAEAELRAELAAEIAAVRATEHSLREQLAGEREQRRELLETTRLEQEQRAARDRAESKVLEALAPVRASLTEMQRKVVDLEAQRNTQHGELAQQLRTATESEERLRSTAESLASALRANSTRGVWGETQLRSVVEAAGLLERVDFDVQTSIRSDAGAGRPDMVVHLPGGKNIAVDAKVPFTAFLEASRIPVTATGAEAGHRDTLMRQHVRAVREHIAALGSKSYWAGLEASPELVIAFIPSESLVSSALEADPSIMEYAFSKRVALASPVTLWSVLKTVAFSWQQDVVTQEAKVLFDVSRELYGRLSTMAAHLDKLGRSIRTTVNDYNRFVGSLEAKVLPSARKLQMLDESTVLGTHTVIEETPRALLAHELSAAPEDDATPADRRARQILEEQDRVLGPVLPESDDLLAELERRENAADRTA